MNETTARHYLNRLRRLADTTHKGKPYLLPEGAISRLDLVERRLLEAIRRDLTEAPARDGYPSGKIGSGGQDSGSSTESAAIAGFRLDNPANVDTSGGHWDDRQNDPHHDLTVKATGHLETAVQAIASLLVTLEAIDKASSTSPHSNPGGSCLVCERHVEGTADDRLRRGMCHTDYTAWVREGRPELVEFQRTRRQEAA